MPDPSGPRSPGRGVDRCRGVGQPRLECLTWAQEVAGSSPPRPDWPALKAARDFGRRNRPL